jgi:GDP-L-fucose synthase
MKKILIFGGFGFMGKNLNKVFTNSDYEIYNESRSTGCDMIDLESVILTIKKVNPDIIINAAAHVGSIDYVTKYAANVVRDNSLMYLNLYEAVKHVNPKITIINPISNCSYPGIVDIQNEIDWWNGSIHTSVESYGTPKKLGFIVSECYKKQFGIKTVNLIIPNSYGPGDYTDPNKTHAMNGIIIRMLTAKNNNDSVFTVWGTGTPIREWIYMEDVVNIIKLMIDNEMYSTLPNPINLGQEEGISIMNTVLMVQKILDYKIEIVCDTTKQDGAPIKILGKKLFQKYFPNFKFTSYEEGIKNTIEYYTNIIPYY